MNHLRLLSLTCLLALAHALNGCTPAKPAADAPPADAKRIETETRDVLAYQCQQGYQHYEPGSAPTKLMSLNSGCHWDATLTCRAEVPINRGHAEPYEADELSCTQAPVLGEQGSALPNH